jgi:hypothetical protein
MSDDRDAWVYLYYGVCRGCNRTPTVVGPLDPKTGYCRTCSHRNGRMWLPQKGETSNHANGS